MLLSYVDTRILDIGLFSFNVCFYHIHRLPHLALPRLLIPTQMAFSPVVSNKRRILQVLQAKYSTWIMTTSFYGPKDTCPGVSFMALKAILSIVCRVLWTVFFHQSVSREELYWISGCGLYFNFFSFYIAIYDGDIYWREINLRWITWVVGSQGCGIKLRTGLFLLSNKISWIIIRNFWIWVDQLSSAFHCVISVV